MGKGCFNGWLKDGGWVMEMVVCICILKDGMLRCVGGWKVVRGGCSVFVGCWLS